MNVDLYVGTLTRYYSGDWKNARTRAGERSPFGPQRKTTGVDVTDPVELQGILAEWLENANTKLKDHLKEPLSWQEGMLPPYNVGDIGIPGYGGVVLLAAYTNNAHLQRPVTFMKTWNNDPAVEAMMKTEKSDRKDPVWEILNCTIWFPARFAFGIGMKDPAGAPIKAGSIDLLWNALEYLNETNWGAKPEDIATWRTRKLSETDTFDTQAQYGFSVFYEMCHIARQDHLPMKLHY
jgi:hypothetical protein